MTQDELAEKLKDVPQGALLLIKDIHNQFSLYTYKDLNKISGHLGCGWGVTAGSNYTSRASHTHCSIIKSIKVIQK